MRSASAAASNAGGTSVELLAKPARRTIGGKLLFGIRRELPPEQLLPLLAGKRVDETRFSHDRLGGRPRAPATRGRLLSRGNALLTGCIAHSELTIGRTSVASTSTNAVECVSKAKCPAFGIRINLLVGASMILK